MRSNIDGLSCAFTAGTIGGLVNSITVWVFGMIGITGALGVGIMPKLTPAWLYPRLVWGGLWGLLFVIPVLKGKSVFLRGAIYSIFPTLVQLFIVFPYKAGKGMLGADLGTLTFLFVIVFNLVWGISAAYWISLSDRDETAHQG